MICFNIFCIYFIANWRFVATLHWVTLLVPISQQMFLMKICTLLLHIMLSHIKRLHDSKQALYLHWETKKFHVTLLQYSLYDSSLEQNLQYLWDWAVLNLTPCPSIQLGTSSVRRGREMNTNWARHHITVWNMYHHALLTVITPCQLEVRPHINLATSHH